ncbi:MAG: zf-HC2 domain-containing protein [Gammaproteobacteria bacterium]|nr:zf-HC2 domain-containing protein [Gammaproteobacteria bacterium]
MLSCREVSRLASERMDRELSWREQIAFYMHLMMCRLCRRYARQLALLQRATGKLRQRRDDPVDWAALPEEARERIARRLRENSA